MLFGIIGMTFPADEFRETFRLLPVGGPDLPKGNAFLMGSFDAFFVKIVGRVRSFKWLFSFGGNRIGSSLLNIYLTHRHIKLYQPVSL